MSAVPLPAHHCPLCGQPNHCAPAREGHFAVECWCAAVRIERNALQRVAPEQWNRACLCAACALQSDSTPR